MRTVIKLISSCFFLGHFPFMSGTIASLAGVGLYLLIKDNNPVYVLTMLVVIILGFLTCGKAEDIFGKKDSRKIVIDELAGILIALYLLPFRLSYLIAAFIIFRILDILKPYPLRRIENLKGSCGVMLDDIAAAVYTNIIMQIVVRYFIK